MGRDTTSNDGMMFGVFRIEIQPAFMETSVLKSYENFEGFRIDDFGTFV